MAIETFTWSPDGETEGEIAQRRRSSQFGDGYQQVTADGINAEQGSWPVTFGGTEDEIRPIRDFLRRHQGSKAFLWTPPLGELGLYRNDGLFRVNAKGGGIYVLSTTFETAFHP
ncbi:phage tail protein [Pseudomonas sp. KSR10]|uniref:phage tail protein n=1 Tax=Pseudomonas sp. KSR10 TaxID=2916654 RepID=UPI001EF798F3|nr:phage tail protein [Pseudomonas sp. KSR10]MCG6541752.1 phage tail protein [Pseudomonas sp. KSR10]